MDKKLHAILHGYRKPRTNDKHVGIELEFSSPIPLEELGRELINVGLDEYCSLHHDGGHYEGEHSLELAMIIPQSQMKAKFIQLGQILSELGCKYHPRAGFHVHLDMRFRNPAKAFMNLVNTQDILFAVADKVRTSGDGATWCKKVTTTALGGASSDTGHPRDRFTDNDEKGKAITPHLSEGKNTIEVRIRESCLDGLDIYSWVKLLCTIVDSPYIMKKITTIRALEQHTKLAEDLRGYVRAKARTNKKLV